MKLCRDRIALIICGTTVSSYPTMPGKTAASPFSLRRAMRFSRSSSLTWRVRKRSSEKRLRRRSPSVRGTLMKGPPPQTNFTRLYAASLNTFSQRGDARLMYRPVPACLFTRLRNAAQLGQNALQIPRDGLNPLALRAHRQQFLFEIEIERQRSCQVKRKLVLIGGRKVLHCARE